MNVGRSVFAQLMDSVPMHEFRKAVKQYNGNYRARSFSCWDQFLCMAFAQLTYRESLRDIESCLRALKAKLYHCGLRGTISRSTLADANEKRAWQIYQQLGLRLIDKARELYRDDKFLAELQDAVYAFDSTMIDLCLTLFPWAHPSGHTSSTAALKLHTLFDVQSNLPSFIRVSPASVQDVLMLDELQFEAGAFYILDRGYLDFARLHRIEKSRAFFVIRAKRPLQFSRLISHTVNKATGVMVDQTVSLAFHRSHRSYPEHLRRIKFYDRVNNRRLVFLTNNFVLDAFTITELYRSRWQIELFFKWIKQHLRIKAFYGTSPNAVKTQVWIAVSIFVLVAIVKKEYELEQSLYTILQILSVTLLEKEPIKQVLTASEHQIYHPFAQNQLSLFTS
jgi:hypothetical protein